MASTSHQTFRVAALAGDGTGPDLVSCAERVLSLIQSVRRSVTFQVSHHEFGGAAIATRGEALPESTLQACRDADAVIVGGCNDPTYGIEPEKGLLNLRQQLGGFANVRPVRFSSSQLAERSSFKAELVENLDMTFFRDLTSGVYYGQRQEANEAGEAFDTTPYSRAAVEQLARLAGNYAMHFTPPKPVHSVDKIGRAHV